MRTDMPLISKSASSSSTPFAETIAELRLVALFVAKRKTNAAETKVFLAKLTPARRKYVMDNFRSELTGSKATQALEEYIKECDETNCWAESEAETEKKTVEMKTVSSTSRVSAAKRQGLLPSTAEPA